jgi:hypothetical protein
LVNEFNVVSVDNLIEIMDSFNDFIHKNWGLHKYRPSIKVRTDAFYEYLPAEIPKDQ